MTETLFIISVPSHEIKDGYLLFAINHDQTEEELSISLQMEEDGTYTVRELTEEDESTLETEDVVCC